MYFFIPNRTAMTWAENKDIFLMREMGAEGIFQYKAGSRERGNVWQVIANNLNQHEGFEVTARSVRDRFNTISRKHSIKTAKELKSTGEGGEEPSEHELLLEELMELNEDSERKISEQTQATKAAADAERRKAVETRQKAMETMGESRKRLAEEKGEEREKKKRRTGGDTIAWLREKTKVDADVKEREMDIQKKEREMQLKERNQQVENNAAASATRTAKYDTAETNGCSATAATTNSNVNETVQ